MRVPPLSCTCSTPPLFTSPVRLAVLASNKIKPPPGVLFADVAGLPLTTMKPFAAFDKSTFRPSADPSLVSIMEIESCRIAAAGLAKPPASNINAMNNSLLRDLFIFRTLPIYSQPRKLGASYSTKKPRFSGLLKML